MENAVNNDRDSLRRQFLSICDLASASVEPLAQDASFRRYFRVHCRGQSRILMDAPPVKENIEPFISIARHLISLGLKAPTIFEYDIASGFILLEDLGDNTFTNLLSADHNEYELYRLAVDTLINLHDSPHALNIDLPEYSTDRLIDEALLLSDWYLPKMTSAPLNQQNRNRYISCWRSIIDSLPEVDRTLVLRDYHVDNLIRLTGGQCALLDFQDALIGPAAYDLVSLLEDARRDIDPELKQQMLSRYFAAFEHLERDSFLRWFAVLGAQRHCKVLGIFTRLSVRDGKHHYLGHLPRVNSLLKSHLDHDDLRPLKTWLGQNGFEALI